MKAREINCAVLIVGAGLSGIAAAVAASRKGVQTLLLEQNAFTGGTVISGMHRYLCGLYPDKGSTTINAGIARELVFYLRSLDRRNRKLSSGKVGLFAFRGKDLQHWINTQIRSSKNLKALLNSRVYELTQVKGVIRGVGAKKGGQEIKVFPKVVIDASGEGAVIKLSHANCRLTALSRRQLAGFSFRVEGADDAPGLLPIKVPYYIKFATYVALDNPGEGVIRLNIPAGQDLSELRSRARKAFCCLRKVLPEFRNASIAEFSPFMVEREGIRLRGEYTLTAKDILSGKRFRDGVVRGAWPIELWDRKKGPQYKYLKFAQYYEIPLRCLRSKNIKNLLAAGRCISVTPEALGSTRVAGTCIAIGEQAGLAAVKLCASY